MKQITQKDFINSPLAYLLSVYVEVHVDILLLSPT